MYVGGHTITEATQNRQNTGNVWALKQKKAK